jgi:hypothetical protein
MPFTAGVPLPSDTLSKSQGDILDNFTAINNYFGTDHVNFTSSSNIGQHNQITFLGKFVGSNPPADVPAPTDGVLIKAEWIPAAGKDHFVLWYREKDSMHSPAAYQLTATYSPSNASTGFTYLPGGLCMMWGIETPLTDYTTTVTFPKTNVAPDVYFDSAPYSISLTPITDYTTSNVREETIFVEEGSVTASGFTTIQTSYHHITGFYWTAIGPCK